MRFLSLPRTPLWHYLLFYGLLPFPLTMMHGETDPSPALRLFLAGDSTLAPKTAPPANPERGWGEALPWFFEDSLMVENRALGGRSTRSFRDEGHWDRLLGDLRLGDAVLIQFGHNDAKSEDPTRYADAQSDYREFLTTFVRDVRSRGAIPLLATSIVRRHFDAEGTLRSTHGDYPGVAREVAGAENVPLLDMKRATAEVVSALGPEVSKGLYLWPTAGHFTRFPEGQRDNTHLSHWGASVFAQLAVEKLRVLDTPLRAHLKPPRADFLEIIWEPLEEEAAPEPGEFLRDGRVVNVRQPRLAAFRSTIGEGPRAAVIICPGGGYGHLAVDHEGIEVARWFNALGFDAYVLKYRLKEFGYPAPLQDLTRALRHLRNTSSERDLDPRRLGVVGFSAGGHLAGLAATRWGAPEAQNSAAAEDLSSARPDFAVLIYPVVSMHNPHANRGSRENLLGGSDTPEMRDALSLERQVSRETPPVFLVHAATDRVVSAENSLLLASALRAQGVPVEFHLFSSGPHGFGLRPVGSPVDHWPELLARWLEPLLVSPPVETEGRGR